MACFLVPAAEAVITTALTKIVEAKENKKPEKYGDTAKPTASKLRFSRKLKWLNNMLWGGSALLAFEHIWHGEVIMEFPFLTAVKTGETAGMLQEMGTSGVAMAVLVTGVWALMAAGAAVLARKHDDTLQEE